MDKTLPNVSQGKLYYKWTFEKNLTIFVSWFRFRVVSF